MYFAVEEKKKLTADSDSKFIRSVVVVLSASEVGPILVLIAPSPLQKKKHCKHIFSQIIQLIVTHLITIMIN